MLGADNRRSKSWMMAVVTISIVAPGIVTTCAMHVLEGTAYGKCKLHRAALLDTPASSLSPHSHSSVQYPSYA